MVEGVDRAGGLGEVRGAGEGREGVEWVLNSRPRLLSGAAGTGTWLRGCGHFVWPAGVPGQWGPRSGPGQGDLSVDSEGPVPSASSQGADGMSVP